MSTSRREIGGGHTKGRTDLDDPFPELRRIDSSVCTKHGRPRDSPGRGICALVIFLVLLVFLVVALWLEFSKDLLERVSIGKEPDPVPLVGEGSFEDPPLWRCAALLGFGERLVDFVQVVHQELLDLVGERAREMERFRRRSAEGRVGVLGEEQGDGVCEIGLANQAVGVRLPS